MARLLKILKELDETHVFEAITIRHDKAREDYSLHVRRITSFSEFLEQLCLYYKFHRLHASGIKVPEAMVAGEVKGLVQQAFRGDLTSVFIHVKHGQEGGIKRVIDGIAESLKQQEKSHWTDHVKLQSYDPSDREQRRELAQEYLELFKHFVVPGADIHDKYEIAERLDDFLRALVEQRNEIIKKLAR